MLHTDFLPNCSDEIDYEGYFVLYTLEKQTFLEW